VSELWMDVRAGRCLRALLYCRGRYLDFLADAQQTDGALCCSLCFPHNTWVKSRLKVSLRELGRDAYAV
jgi:hypothetical protein